MESSIETSRSDKSAAAFGFFTAFVIVNFIVFSFVVDWIGGTAEGGKIEAGRYYLGSHGHYREVSQALFQCSHWHGIITFGSFGLLALWFLWHIISGRYSREFNIPKAGGLNTKTRLIVDARIITHLAAMFTSFVITYFLIMGVFIKANGFQMMGHLPLVIRITILFALGFCAMTVPNAIARWIGIHCPKQGCDGTAYLVNIHPVTYTCRKCGVGHAVELNLGRR